MAGSVRGGQGFRGRGRRSVFEGIINQIPLLMKVTIFALCHSCLTFAAALRRHLQHSGVPSFFNVYLFPNKAEKLQNRRSGRSVLTRQFYTWFLP